MCSMPGLRWSRHIMQVDGFLGRSHPACLQLARAECGRGLLLVLENNSRAAACVAGVPISITHPTGGSAPLEEGFSATHFIRVTEHYATGPSRQSGSLLCELASARAQ